MAKWPIMTGTWVVVLTWNGRADTLDLLAGLTAEQATVLVVDNGSTDGTESSVRARFPAVRYLQTGANLGYAGGNNAGIAYALEHGADVVCVLNNDTVVEPGFLDPLLAAVGSGVRAVSPDIRYAGEPDVSWFRGSVLERRSGWPTHIEPEAQSAASHPFPSPVLTGCCLLATADTWRRVGLFDAGLFLMFEDSDWSMRAAAQGVELLVIPASRIRHKVSRSFTGSAATLGAYYFARNGTVFAWRHLGRRAALRFAARQVLRPGVRRIAARGQRASAAVSFLGLAAAAFGRRGEAGSMARRLARRAPARA